MINFANYSGKWNVEFPKFINVGTVELESNIHKLGGSIQNDQLLRTLYRFLKVRQNSQNGKLWNSLTEELKQDFLLAFEE